MQRPQQESNPEPHCEETGNHCTIRRSWGYSAQPLQLLTFKNVGQMSLLPAFVSYNPGSQSERGLCPPTQRCGLWLFACPKTHLMNSSSQVFEKETSFK